MKQSSDILLITRDAAGKAHIFGPAGILCRQILSHYSASEQATPAALVKMPHCPRCAREAGISSSPALPFSPSTQEASNA